MYALFAGFVERSTLLVRLRYDDKLSNEEEDNSVFYHSMLLLCKLMNERVLVSFHPKRSDCDRTNPRTTPCHRFPLQVLRRHMRNGLTVDP
jgi:hypothetical protein